ncbi:MAG: PspC domain-containing protein [candidate division Zixibacteria bacterium]|nr:PspC domain-containing protein [candidate division Zixibacteria bacterium]
MTKELRKSPDKIIAGVCAGLAEYFDVDPTIVRLAFVALALAGGGWMILVYILAWIIMPAPKMGEVVAEAEETEMANDSKISQNRGKWLGVILVILGFGFLMDNLHFIYWWHFSKFWPLIIIGLGGLIIYRSLRKKDEEVTYESE